MCTEGDWESLKGMVNRVERAVQEIFVVVEGGDHFDGRKDELYCRKQVPSRLMERQGENGKG